MSDSMARCTRAARCAAPNNPYRRQRPPIDWSRVLMLLGAILMTASVLAYKLTTP